MLAVSTTCMLCWLVGVEKKEWDALMWPSLPVAGEVLMLHLLERDLAALLGDKSVLMRSTDLDAELAEAVFRMLRVVDKEGQPILTAGASGRLGTPGAADDNLHR
jgi:hypothetical protein